MATIRHVVESWSSPLNRWAMVATFPTDREAAEYRREFEAIERHAGHGTPKTRIRVGDPAVLLTNMNDGQT